MHDASSSVVCAHRFLCASISGPSGLCVGTNKHLEWTGAGDAPPVAGHRNGALRYNRPGACGQLCALHLAGAWLCSPSRIPSAMARLRSSRLARY